MRAVRSLAARWQVVRAPMSALLELLVAALIIYSLVFLVANVLPLDPARAMLGPVASEAAVASLRENLGLDEGLWVRYFGYLSRMLHGDFGPSFFYGRPAGEILVETAPMTLGRALAAVLLGTVAGVAAAWFSGQRSLSAVRSVLAILQSTPALCLLVLFLWLFSRGLGTTPLQSRLAYEILGVMAAAAYPAGAVGSLLCERLNLAGNPPRHIELLSLLHAPTERLRAIILGESLPAIIMVALNALLPALTGITFMEFIYGLDGFGAVFLHSCERGDLSIIVAGSMTVAIMLLVIQRSADHFLARFDSRLAKQYTSTPGP